MPAPYLGGCTCGEVRYVLNGEPLTLYACHCTDCQRRTGSAFALSLWVSRSAVEVQKGKTVLCALTLDDGRIKQRRMCATCSTGLWGEPVKRPELVVIQPGTLDDTTWLRPVAHIWTRSAQSWFLFPKDVALFEKQPEPGVLAKLWQERSSPSA